MADWSSILPPSVVADTNSSLPTPQDPQLTTPPPPQNTAAATPNGPPYPPTTALVGGVPTTGIDDPISAVLLAIFIGLAAAHMITFQKNRRRGHLFVFSAMLFAFCIVRGVGLILRLAWASYPTNVRLAIAATILTQAGTIIAFIVNLFFAQRVVRASHSRVGWSTPARIVFRFLLASIIACLIMLIAVSVQSFYTLDAAARDADRKVQLFAGTYLAVLAFLPVPIVLLCVAVPSRHRVEKFGTGSWHVKLILLFVTSCLLTLGAGFRVGTSYAPRPQNNPAWYHSRAAYYCFNFAVEITVAALYLVTGFHRRFHIPEGGRKGPGAYISDSQPTNPAGLTPGEAEKGSRRLDSRLSTTALASDTPTIPYVSHSQQASTNQGHQFPHPQALRTPPRLSNATTAHSRSASASSNYKPHAQHHHHQLNQPSNIGKDEHQQPRAGPLPEKDTDSGFDFGLERPPSLFTPGQRYIDGSRSRSGSDAGSGRLSRFHEDPSSSLRSGDGAGGAGS